MSKDPWFQLNIDAKEIKREREKARELRKSQWWKNILAKGTCHYCEQKIAASELTMDHIVPLARGGKSTKGNIVASCKKCNSKKKLETPVEAILNQLNHSTTKNNNDNEDN